MVTDWQAIFSPAFNLSKAEQNRLKHDVMKDRMCFVWMEMEFG